MHNNKKKKRADLQSNTIFKTCCKKMPLLDIDMNVHVTLHRLHVYLLLQPSLLQKRFGILLHTTTT